MYPFALEAEKDRDDFYSVNFGRLKISQINILVGLNIKLRANFTNLFHSFVVT